MPHQPSTYTDFRRIPYWAGQAAREACSTTWFRQERETQSDADADVIELRCRELQYKTQLENALYQHAYDSMHQPSMAC